MHRTLSAAAVATLAACATAQLDHMHLTVDTESGQAGDQTLIQTGWFSGEEDMTIGADGYVRYQGEIFVARLNAGEYSGDPWDGRYFGATPRLTSDFFFPTGRLNGGDFNFEIIDVRPVTGGGSTVFGWAENHNGMLMNVTDSDGADRDARSFYVGTNRHMHHQVQSSTDRGMWDVTLVAWDANGRYTDSDPVHVRFDVVPAPGGLAALGAGALVALRRRR